MRIRSLVVVDVKLLLNIITNRQTNRKHRTDIRINVKFTKTFTQFRLFSREYYFIGTIVLVFAQRGLSRRPREFVRKNTLEDESNFTNK